MLEASFRLNYKEDSINGIYVKSKSKSLKILEQLSKKDCLFGIDTETEALPEYSHIFKAGLSPHLAKVRLLQISDGKSSIVFDLKFINDNSIFIPFLESKKFIGHYAIFDLQFFMLMGVKKMDLNCSYIAAKLCIHAHYPDGEEMGASLKELAKEILGIDVSKEVQVSNWSNPELTFEQIEYAAFDSIYALKLWEKLYKGVKKYKMEAVYDLYKQAQFPLASMQINGIGFDVEKHKILMAKWKVQLIEAKREIEALTGVTNITSHTIASWLESNLSEHDLSVWPRTDKEKLSVDANTLAEFSYLPLVIPFEKYQKSLKLLTTYGTKLVDKINPKTGRLHTRFNLCGARTGRLSSSEPNLQNAPRDKEFRSLFIPSPGKVFVCADFSQIELRVAAEISKDKQMIHAYKEGLDIHRLTAQQILKKEDVSYVERQAAKAVSLGLLFGLGAKKLGAYARKPPYGADFTEHEALEAVKIWRKHYSGYYNWQKEQGKRCGETLYVRDPLGKLRRLKEDKYYGAGLNHPIQSAAAHIILFSLVKLLKSTHIDDGVSLCNSVHDEILIQVSEENVDFYKELLSNVMTYGYEEVFPEGLTKNLVESGSGYNWGEAK